MTERTLLHRLDAAHARLRTIEGECVQGKIVSAAALGIGISGLTQHVAIGDRVSLIDRHMTSADAEIVGIRDGVAHALAFTALDGLGPYQTVSVPLRPTPATLPVSDAWIGRVVDPLGRPLDGCGPLSHGDRLRPVRVAPPAATTRARLGSRLAFGIRALDLFTTCRKGQRLGLFAGAGVGKSTLLGMLARHADCDVAVVALVGERGREVREFLEDDLGPDGSARAVVVVATSDTPPLLRREAAYAAMTIAEHFRDQGRHVLLLVDSLTRHCLALREIALAAGEPPATRGYPPGVFAELPRLLERAGPGADGEGQITGMFTVLMEGDDPSEPVADAARGFLDGHVMLDRGIAERGRYPAIDVLRSLSRCASACLDPNETALLRQARAVLATALELSDLVRLGAYRTGADATADEALVLAPRIEALLAQGRDETFHISDSFSALRGALEKV
jgi:flagellum-specific ATP synthase